MEIISKLIEIEACLPIDNEFIEEQLRAQKIDPIRWAIVKVDKNKLTISVAFENLC